MSSDSPGNIIDGKAFAARLREQVARHVSQLQASHALAPGLAVVMAGENPASQIYVRNKIKQTLATGMQSFEHRLSDTVSERELLSLVSRLNDDPRVHGILVQLPIPAQVREAAVIDAIDPAKDVDGFHISNAGLLATGGDGLVPCTPLGCLMLLKDRLGDLSGKRALVLGRSNIVGKPMAQLLIRESCTVTVAHSRTRDLPGECRRAEILVAAVGRPQMVLGEWVSDGATVIDVGINRVDVGGGKTRLVGDVDFDSVAPHAGGLTPVPGGVGPMTIACLLHNTVTAACRQHGIPQARVVAVVMDAPITSVADVQGFLMTLVRDDPRPYRERAGQSLRNMARLLQALGRPDRGLRVAHVAGSKGKGSVALMLEALLQAEDLRVGTYTSPHLVRWNERLRVLGKPVNDQGLVDAMRAVQPHVLAFCAADPARRPSFFDALTAAALWLFQESGCQLAVLECGLGGRYDATNAVHGEVACITSIELEHTDKLGDTLSQIAWHKAGIARRDRPLVCAALDPAAHLCIERECQATGARMLSLGKDFLLELEAPRGGQRRLVVHDEGQAFPIQLGHPAQHMACNASLALVMARRLGVSRPDTRALSALALPGRAQLLHNNPAIVVDGAHTAESLAALGDSLSVFHQSRRVFVVSITRGKDPAALTAVLRGASCVVVTCADPLRSLPAAELHRALGRALAELPEDGLLLEPEPERALARGFAVTGADALLCICGSVYMAGAGIARFGDG